MPAVSKAQQRYLQAAASRGEVPQKVADEFAVSGKAFKKLPEKVKKDSADHVSTQKREHSDD